MNYNFKVYSTVNCYSGCSKDIQAMSNEETPATELNVNSISDTIESVIYAACSKPANVVSC